MPRRVFFVNRYFFPDESATSQLLGDLAFHLAGRGHQVHVVTSRQRYEDPRAGLPGTERVRGVQVHRVWTSAFGRRGVPGRAADYASFYPTAAGRLWRLLRTGDVVVVKTDPPLLAVPVAAAARLRGARLVNWVQDLFPEVAAAYGMRLARGPLGAALRRMRDWSYRQAACNVAVAEAMADRLRAAVPGRAVRVIPNWADGQAISPSPAAGNALRAGWELDGCFVVGYSGNLGRAHDAADLLAAAQELAGEPRVRFLIIGGGAQRDVLAARCGALNLGHVLFKPYQPRERLGESLAVADVHLVSLRPDMEGLVFPSKLYGALAAGRPVIVIGDPRGETGRLVEAEGCGVAVAAGAGGALAQAIRALAADPLRRAEMGQRARRLFEDRFDRPIALAAWGDLLTTV